MLKNFSSHLTWKLSWTPFHKWSPLFQGTWTRLSFPLQNWFTMVHCRLWNMVHGSNLNWNRCIPYEERINTVLCSQALQVWKHWTGIFLEGTKGTNEPSDFISVQKTPPKCICLKRLPWKRKTTLYTLRKIELFFHFMDNFWRWKC